MAWALRVPAAQKCGFGVAAAATAVEEAQPLEPGKLALAKVQRARGATVEAGAEAGDQRWRGLQSPNIWSIRGGRFSHVHGIVHVSRYRPGRPKNL